jgi:septum site-determining protein MinD
MLARAMSAKVVTVTSGKGGVGKTTTAASFAFGLAEQGYKTVVIDFDIGLRNLDIHLGCERRVIFDFVNVLQGECTMNQALIKDKRQSNLSIIAASQTKDKNILTTDGVGKFFSELKDMNFDYIVCDSPAGIESGARHAMYFADEAIICTNPELSSCRDSDKMIGFIAANAKTSANGGAVIQRLLVTRYDATRAEKGESLSLDDIGDLLGLELVGVIPESKSVLTSCNVGQPVYLSESNAGGAYQDMVKRFLDQDVPMRFVDAEQPGFFDRFFQRAA